MEQTIQQQIVNKIRILPEEKQKEILEYAKKISEGEESGEDQQEEKPQPRKLFQKFSARDKNNVKGYLKIESGCVFELR